MFWGWGFLAGPSGPARNGVSKDPAGMAAALRSKECRAKPASSMSWAAAQPGCVLPRRSR